MSVKKTADRIKVSAELKISTPEEAGKALTDITLLAAKERQVSSDAVNGGKDALMTANGLIRNAEGEIEDIVRDIKSFADVKLDLIHRKVQSVSLPEGKFGYRKDRDVWQFVKAEEFKEKLKATTTLDDYEKETLFEEELVEVVKFKINKAEVKKMADRPDADKIFKALGVVFIQGQKQFYVQKDNTKAVEEFRALMSQFEGE